jgi:hypothetical protein
MVKVGFIGFDRIDLELSYLYFIIKVVKVIQTDPHLITIGFQKASLILYYKKLEIIL